jgi:hypothetical protein
MTKEIIPADMSALLPLDDLASYSFAAVGSIARASPKPSSVDESDYCHVNAFTPKSRACPSRGQRIPHRPLFSG